MRAVWPSVLSAMMMMSCTNPGLSSPPQSAPEAEAASSPAAPTAADAQAPADGLSVLQPEAFKAQFQGQTDRPRLYNFWATWCAPCVAEMPLLLEFSQQHSDVEVILINLDHPKLTNSHVRPFLKKHKLTGLSTWQIDAVDAMGSVSDTVPDWPGALPYTVMKRADGTVASKILGGTTAAELDTARLKAVAP